MSMTILGKVSFLACFLATIFGTVALENGGQCSSPQYAEISQEGLIQCVVPSTFTGVVWYNSTDITHDSLVLRIERQPDGSLRTSGDGVDSGSYTISSNGSLIIPVVTSEHDRNFTVLILDENYEVSQFIVEFITVVYSHQRLPAVNSCEENLVCLELVTWNATLSCVFQYAKPAVNLFWYKFNKGEFANLEATQHSYSEDGFSFSSVVDITISSLRENSLNVFSCRAYGPAVRVEQAGTDVLVFAQNTEFGYDRSCHTEIKKKIVFVDSSLVIPCTDNILPYAFIWQFSRTNHSEFLMLSTNGTVRLLNEMSVPMEVSTDGSLTFSHVKWNVTGIFTCYFLVGDTSYCSNVEIEVEPRNASASVWIILLSVAVPLVSSLLIISVTFYVWRQKNIVPRKTYVRMADAIKDWHFNTIADSKIFKDDAINLLRNVSNEIEENRKKKNIGVIIGAAVGIAAGGITILGTALIPFTFGGSVGLAVAGAAVGTAGAGISIGYSLEKLINDQNRVTLVRPALEAFIYIQKELAETVVWLSIAYKIAGSKKWRQRLTKEKMKISKSFLREIQALHTGERKSFGQMFSKLNTKAKELVNIATEGAEFENEDEPLETTSQWERYLQEGSASPFDYLNEAVITVLQKQKALHDTPILFTFIKEMYASDTTAVDCQNMEVNTDTANATGSYYQGGFTAGRVTMNVLSLSDDAAKVGANVGKIARGVSVAGVVLSAVGIVVDLVFLGHAVYDLLSKEREQFSQALLDASDVMVKMNSIASYIYSMQVGTSLPNSTVQSNA